MSDEAAGSSESWAGSSHTFANRNGADRFRFFFFSKYVLPHQTIAIYKQCLCLPDLSEVCASLSKPSNEVVSASSPTKCETTQIVLYLWPSAVN